MNQSVSPIQSTIPVSSVHAYTITRSPTSFQRFNVVAVDKRGELLATVKVDLEFEDAAMMVEVLNGSSSAVEVLNGETV